MSSYFPNTLREYIERLCKERNAQELDVVYETCRLLGAPAKKRFTSICVDLVKESGVEKLLCEYFKDAKINHDVYLEYALDDHMTTATEEIRVTSAQKIYIFLIANFPPVTEAVYKRVGRAIGVSAFGIF